MYCRMWCPATELEVSSLETKVQRCHLCGGYGQEGGCPRCGLTPRKSVVKKALQLDIPADIIPIPYQGKLWIKPEVADLSMKFKAFDDDLSHVLDSFLQGIIPRFSMFIAAPGKYGKHEFVYSCMQTSLAQQFSVAPLFSTSDWRRLYRVSQMNPMYKLYNRYRWDTLIMMDVLFISVDHSDDRFDVVRLMKDVLDTRASFSRPTFFVSDYKLEELVPHWGDETYSMIYNPDKERDYFRYPVILQRF